MLPIRRVSKVLGAAPKAAFRQFSRPLSSAPAAATADPYILHPESGVFTPEQLEQYQRDGFIVVKKLLSEEEIARYVNRFLDIANGRVEKHPSMLMMRDVTISKNSDEKGQKPMGDMAITKLQEYMFDPVLKTYPALPQLLRYANTIAGPNLRAMHTMLINKPPDTGKGSSRHPPHQDLWYFTFRPINRIVCTWTALQPITRAIGGLFVLPGSHVMPLQKHDYPTDGLVNRAYFGIQHMAEEKYEDKMVHLEMDPGDTVIFHPLLVHGSGRNSSNTTRKAISCHYAATECHFEDQTGQLQEAMVEEIMDMTAKKRKVNGRADLTFEELWVYKSGLVSGVDVNLHTCKLHKPSAQA